MSQYDIIEVNNHYEVYCDGKFFSKANNLMDAAKKVNKENKSKEK